VIFVVLSPDSSTCQFVVLRSVESIIDAADHSNQPGDDGQDLVGPNGFGIMGLPLCERVGLTESIHFDVLVEFLFLLWKVDALLLKYEVE